MYWREHMFAGHWIFGLIMMLIFWALVAWAVIALVRSNRGQHMHGMRHHGGAASAEQILADRFARGEIEADEFRSRAQALRELHPHS